MYSSIEGGNRDTSAKKRFRHSSSHSRSHIPYESSTKENFSRADKIDLSQIRPLYQLHEYNGGNFNLLLTQGLFCFIAGVDGILKIRTFFKNGEGLCLLNKVAENSILSIGAIANWNETNIVALSESGDVLYILDENLKVIKEIVFAESERHTSQTNSSKFLTIINNIAVWNHGKHLHFCNLETSEQIVTRGFFNIEFADLEILSLVCDFEAKKLFGLSQSLSSKHIYLHYGDENRSVVVKENVNHLSIRFNLCSSINSAEKLEI